MFCRFNKILNVHCKNHATRAFTVQYQNFHLQCGFDYIRPGDKLIHIFTHHIQKTEDQLREILRREMLKHLDWVEKLCRVVLSEVNVSIEDYIDTMSTPGVPLDFTAIVVLA